MVLSSCGAFLFSKADEVPVPLIIALTEPFYFVCNAFRSHLFVYSSGLGSALHTWLCGLKLNQKIVTGRILC